MWNFDVRGYGDVAAELLRDERLNELGPGRPNVSVQAQFAKATAEGLFAGKTIVNQEMAYCCVAALWMWHDFLDASHNISKRIRTAEGKYWHGIRHRREPDYFNARHWFRKVGEHPIHPPLCREAREMAAETPRDPASQFLLTQARWKPDQFVELCHKCLEGQSTSGELARRIARLEWQLLFDYCYRHSLGL